MGLVTVHVDDLQVAFDLGCAALLEAIAELFPIADWESMPYTYERKLREREIVVTQKTYVTRRVDSYS
eukprot:3644047-Alexandrium_andersonii.AAC.1